MGVENFIQPKEIQIEDKKFIISKYPAIAGREIVVNFIASGIPKVGCYAINEEMMLKSMNYVARINENGSTTVLSNKSLIDNHVVSDDSSWEMLISLEKQILEYNCAFFRNGWISNLLETFTQNVPKWISKMWKDSLAQSFHPVTQPTEN